MVSALRIAIWRKLKRLGVAQLGDGLVGLPADARTREQLEWMAEDVTEAGGSAGGWLARPAALAQERELAAAMAAARAAEYAVVAAEAWTAYAASSAVRAAALRRPRAERRRITRRDYFPPAAREQAPAAREQAPAAREQAHAAVEALAGLAGTSPDAVPARPDAAAADSAGEHS